MAKFLTSLLSSSNVKQGLEKGSQGIAHAAVGLVEQFATRGLIGKVLPGVGLINPLLGIFTEPVVSALKAQLNPLFGTQPTENLNRTGAQSSSEQDVGSGVGDQSFVPTVFGTLRNQDNSSAVLAATAKTIPTSEIESTVTSVSPSVAHVSVVPPVPGDQQFVPSVINGLHSIGRGIVTDTQGTMDEFSRRFESKEAFSTEKFVDGRGSKGGTRTVLGEAHQSTAGRDSENTQGIPDKLKIDAVGINHVGTDPLSALKTKGNLATVFSKFNDNSGKEIIDRQGTMKSRPNDTAAGSADSASATALLSGGIPEKVFDPARTGTPLSAKSGLDKQFTTDQTLIDRQRPGALKSVKRFPDWRFGQDANNTRRTPWVEFLQQHRFLVFDVTQNVKDLVKGLSVFEWADGQDSSGLEAGFSYCDAPVMSVRMESIKEGTWEFERQVPVGVEAGRMVLQKGMTRTLTGFYLWIEAFLRGNLTRRTLKILSYGRSLPGSKSSNNWTNMRKRDQRNIYGEWTLYNCAPVRYSAGQGWDARTGEIQIAEIEIVYEWFEESTPQDLQ
jgi:phage tail-like protein